MTEERTIDRYEIGAWPDGSLDWKLDPTGNWCRWEDVEPLQQRVRDLEAALRGILDATGGLSLEATVGAREAIYADLRKLGVVVALGGAGEG